MYRENSSSVPAGGRLIFTNLPQSAFPKTTGETGGAPGLPVVLNDRTIPLEDAAALNANFPPVFSNAAIDVGRNTRYWVTDGGAVDNRGVEMMFYALREAIRHRNMAVSVPTGCYSLT